MLLGLALASFGRAESKLDVSLKPLVEIPARRHAAFVLYAITNRDSSPAVSHKRRSYYAALKFIAEGIKEEYFWHDDFPADVFAGIEDRAAVLVATQYPLSPTTGCSYVDMLREIYMNTMAEEVVLSMAQAICVRCKEKDVEIRDQPKTLNFQDWKKDWESAAYIDGSVSQLVPGIPSHVPEPNQAPEPTPPNRRGSS